MYTAVIIEPRIHPSLYIVLNNFNRNLDDNWSFLIFHGSNNKKYIKNIFNYIKTTKKCTYINLNKSNLTLKEYNNLLYSYFFYSNINTEYFLIFQTDTLLSNYYSKNIYKFFNYDYVGAPWKHRNNEIGNGGLSLRKKSKMLELLNNNFLPNVLNINEDLFFSGSCHNIKNISVYKPSIELAKEFSTESIYSESSFGLHKPWTYLNNRQLKILNIMFPNLNNLINIWNNYDKILRKMNKIKSKKINNNLIKIKKIIPNIRPNIKTNIKPNIKRNIKPNYSPDIIYGTTSEISDTNSEIPDIIFDINSDIIDNTNSVITDNSNFIMKPIRKPNIKLNIRPNIRPNLNDNFTYNIHSNKNLNKNANKNLNKNPNKNISKNSNINNTINPNKKLNIKPNMKLNMMNFNTKSNLRPNMKPNNNKMKLTFNIKSNNKKMLL